MMREKRGEQDEKHIHPADGNCTQNQGGWRTGTQQLKRLGREMGAGGGPEKKSRGGEDYELFQSGGHRPGGYTGEELPRLASEYLWAAALWKQDAGGGRFGKKIGVKQKGKKPIPCRAAVRDIVPECQ